MNVSFFIYFALVTQKIDDLCQGPFILIELTQVFGESCVNCCKILAFDTKVVSKMSCLGELTQNH